MSHADAYRATDEDRSKPQTTEAWTGVLPGAGAPGKRAGSWSCCLCLLPGPADLRAAAGYMRALLLWCTGVLVVGCVVLVVPMGLLAIEAASCQIAAEVGAGAPAGTSLAAWSTSAGEKSSPGFWLFWLLCALCKRLFTYGCFFIMAIGWWDSSLRRLLLSWLPAALAALLSVAWEIVFKLLASRGVLVFTRAVSVAQLAARYAVWFVCIVYCFAKSAPGQQRRTPTCAVIKLVLSGLPCYLCVSQVVQAYWSLEARNPAALLLLASTVLKLQRAVLSHVVIKVCERLPHSTDTLTMTAGLLLHATSNTGLHFLHFVQSADYTSLILVQLCGAVAETSTNLGYILCQTELERWKQLALRAHRAVCRTAAAAHAHSPAELGGGASAQQAESRQGYFACMVMLTNVSELTTLGFTTAMFLLCKRAWAHTLAISGITLAGELVADMCTVALGHRWCSLRGDAVPDVLVGKERLWAGNFILTSVLIACVGATLLSMFLTAMCPYPDHLGGLQEIDRCRAT